MNVFADPLFSVRTPGGTISRLSWAGLLAAAEDGSLHDLVRLQAHQRPRVVLELAVWLHLLRRFSGVRPLTVPAALAALRREGALGAGALIPEEDEPGFAQPVVSGAERGSWMEKPLGLVDTLFTGVGHEAKGPVDRVAAPEDVVFALLSGGQKIFVKDNPDSLRWGVPVVVPVDATGGLAFGVRALADAYDAAGLPADAPWARSRHLSDHVLWLRPLSLAPGAAPLGPGEVAWPFLDVARPIRLAPGPDGRPVAHQFPTMRRMVAPELAAMLADPGVPMQRGSKPFRLVMRRPDHRFLHAVLFGREDVDPAPIALAPPPGTRALRIGAVAFETGKTRGVLDLSIRVPTPVGPPGAAGEASRLALRLVGQVARGALRPALRRLLQPRAQDRLRPLESGGVVGRRIDAAVRRFEDAVTRRSLEWVFEAAADPDPEASLVPELKRDLAAAAWSGFDEEIAGGDPARPDAQLALARARLDLAALLGSALDLDADLPSADGAGDGAAARVADALGEAMRRDPDLRGMDPDRPPLAYWSLLAGPAVPSGWAEAEALQPAWRAVLSAFAAVPHRPGARCAGRALAEAGFGTARLSGLLEARGPLLLAAFAQAWRFLAAAGTPAVDWGNAFALLAADASGDREGERRARARLALAAAGALRDAGRPAMPSAA
ncbi:hypothetical protein [Arenibaculum sp.]|uniref:hypothetical protein n=1 Tax=Arenibaculum sp. TaxID=2865862 RepID=UPI002E1547A9|nr:hypothetical protein [Arenibaculum sp.]